MEVILTPSRKVRNTQLRFVFLNLSFVCQNKIVDSLRLKNEREERLSSHRSHHVTVVWEDCTI